MANPKGNPKNLKSWKQGESGNPSGRPINPPELNMMRAIKKGDLALLLNRVFSASPEELDQIGSTVIERWIAQSAKRAMELGDLSNLFNLLDRLIGKSEPYYVEPSHKDFADMDLDERRAFFELIQKDLKKFEADLVRDEQRGIPSPPKPARLID